MSSPYPSSLSSIPEALRDLAPTHLPNRRATRYLGDGQFARLDALAPADQDAMRLTYADLGELLRVLISQNTDDAGKRLETRRWIDRGSVGLIVERMHHMGDATRGVGKISDDMMRTIHDVRGGALGALVGRLEMLDVWPGALSEKLNMIFCLTRDHLKIMRNSLVGLDDAQRDKDRTPKSHAASLLIEKWHEAVVGPSLEAPAPRMRVDCRYEGPVTECCLESAAIDRIFYNLANNARRHTADGDMEMVIFEVPSSPGECLRFVLSNAITADQARALHELVGAAQPSPASSALRLDAIFAPRASTTGSGYGLAVVADFTAHAFGLKSGADAVREGYVGAVLEAERTFRAWFHWPEARRGLTPKLDDYHHPEQSLSEGGIS